MVGVDVLVGVLVGGTGVLVGVAVLVGVDVAVSTGNGVAVGARLPIKAWISGWERAPV